MDRCPAPYKVGVYLTWELASHALKTIKHKRRKDNAPRPNHVYACTCGYFHLTSQTSEKVDTRRRKQDRLRKQERKERKHRQ